MKQQALLADDQIIVGHVILEPGEKRAPEVHSDMSETIIVLRGSIGIVGAEFVLFGDDAGASEQAYVPAGAEHAVSNASDTEPAELLAIMRKVPA